MGWADFRPKYSELYILRARLPPVTPYLGLTATLDNKAPKVVESPSSFEEIEPCGLLLIDPGSVLILCL